MRQRDDDQGGEASSEEHQSRAKAERSSQSKESPLQFGGQSPSSDEPELPLCPELKGLEGLDPERCKTLLKVLLSLLRRITLSFCNLSERGVDALASLLSSDSSGLRELDLSNHSLPDAGLRRLSAALSIPDCKLETLRLSGCSLSDRSLADLGLPSGRLRELDLSSNRLLDAGVQLLTAGMQRTPSSLDSLRLSECQLSEGSCEALSGLLSSGSSSLSRLDLSNNNLRDSGVRRLSVGIGSPRCRLETLRVKPGGVQWSRPDLRKYSCELRVDANTVNPHVKLSEGGRRLAFSEEGQDYPPHADRFEKDHQLLCAGPLTGRRYWEVEVAGGVHVSVSCGGPGRSGGGGNNNGWFGGSGRSWSLYSCPGGFSAWHNKKGVSIPWASSPSGSPRRVGVYVDREAARVSFYRVLSGALTHLHTFRTTSAEPLYAGFGLWTWSDLPRGSSVTLCSV
ncbi:unnamed protein product [Menidia menidia]|uniref:(Atlantic silverside) hypothetical protein n=1 Tax=Menidia menidia TaxID=238744 RepID=A0A8S4BTY5_9TELE|nr:unnamed protein product [Menidia menidia]